jgi:hypothetical protein
VSRTRGFVALLLLALAGGCVRTVVGESFPALAERSAPITRVAVAPLAARPEEAAPAAPMVARYLAEALAARGVEVVAPEDVARATGGADPQAGVRELAALAERQFGAQAVLLGEITRWVEREGEALGTLRPASVGLRVELYGADGARLWRGEFDHTQQALSENVLVTPRYPGGGTRWLSADELARFAASELATALPLAP